MNNGLFVRDTSYTTTANVDQYHLMNLLKDQQPMDMGVIDLWQQTQKVEMPLYSMANFGGRNTIEVTGARGEYKWQIPVLQEMPKIVEDIETANPVLGQDGATFKIKVDRKAFGHGDIISYDKMNGAEIVISHEDMLPAGNGHVIMTCKLVNNDNRRSLDKRFIKPGTKLFRKGSARSGEYGEKFSEIPDMTTGYREYYNYVGNAEANASFSVSNKAELMMRGGMSADGGTIPVVELWRNFDKSLDPSITSMDEMFLKQGKDYIKSAVKSGSLSRAFVTKLEAASLTKIGNDIENYLMWGKGGRISGEGADDLRLSVGLWPQLDNSFKKIYNKGQFNMDLFKSEIFNFYNGKVDFTGPDPKREIIIQTGRAGMEQVSQAVKREAMSSGLIINASDIGAISGSSMDLNFGFAFTRFTIPYLANVKFVLNPAFDNIHTSDIENPIIDGYPLSSYNYIIFDVTDNLNDNIFLLKLKWDNQLKWFYQNGQMDYMGRSQGFQSSGLFSGYKVFMSQNMPAIWVKDPTKVLKIVMRNPVTGGSF